VREYFLFKGINSPPSNDEDIYAHYSAFLCSLFAHISQLIGSLREQFPTQYVSESLYAHLHEGSTGSKVGTHREKLFSDVTADARRKASSISSEL
jgi:hypothetical protein